MCWLKSHCLSASTNYGDGRGTASLEANGSEHSVCPLSSLVVPIDSTFISATPPNNGHEFALLQTVPTDWTASFCAQEQPLKSVCSDLFQGNVFNEQTMSPECQLGNTLKWGNLRFYLYNSVLPIRFNPLCATIWTPVRSIHFPRRASWHNLDKAHLRRSNVCTPNRTRGF